MMEITLDKAAYSPGDTVRAKITVKLGKPVKARGLFAELVCNERKRTTVRHMMDKYDYDREHELGVPVQTNIHTRVVEESSVKYRKEAKVAGEGNYAEGEFEAVFVLPMNALPTSYEFGHDDKIHVWKLKAKLDIPLALDENAKTEVFVSGL